VRALYEKEQVYTLLLGPYFDYPFMLNQYNFLEKKFKSKPSIISFSEFI